MVQGIVSLIIPSVFEFLVYKNARNFWVNFISCIFTIYIDSVQFSSVAQPCLTLYNPMNHSTPGLPVHHQFLEFNQTHIHWVSDAIQPFHLLLSHSPPASNHSKHQGIFQWVNSSHEVAKILEFQSQHQSCKEHPGLISFRMDWLDLLEVQATTRVFSNTTVQKHQFFSAQLFSQANSHIHTRPLEKP